MIKFIIVFLIIPFILKGQGDVVGQPDYDDPARRFEEFTKQRAFPFEKIPDGARVRAFKQMEEMLSSKNQAQWTLAQQPEWKAIGPFDIGGRMKSIVVHPTKKGLVFAAGAAGGIWRSTNNGDWWEPIFDFENGIAFGSIAIDPNNPDVIYAGTGESVLGGGTIYLGNGIYKSTDEGNTWKLLGLTEVGAFSKVYVHPMNSNIVVAGATIRQPGFYKSTDAGKSWQRLFDQNVTDVSINPENPDEYLIGVNAEGVYFTTDGGLSWVPRNSGFEGGTGRVSVQFAPSDPSIAYALLDIASAGYIYRTTNKGQSWTLVYRGDANFFRGQGFYDNFILVHPTNPNIVLAGGIDVFRTSDGKNWNNVTNGYSGGNVHVDQHTAGFDPKNPNIVFLGNDGGIYLSTDAGINWTRKNNNLQVTQFYGFDIDNTQPNINFGGTQDNGTLGSDNDSDWSFIAGGDGFRTAVDYTSPNIVFGQSTPGGRIIPFKLDLNTGAFSFLDKGIDFTAGVWDPPLIIDPQLNYILYHGRDRLYASYDYGANWERLKTPTSGGRFTAIDVSPLNSEVIMAGTSIGEVIISKDAGENWELLNENGIPSRWVTDIAFSSKSEGTAFVSLSGFYTPHIFKTTDYGKTWINLSEGLPDIPVNAIAIHPLDENLVFIATDIGVFGTFDGGKNWFPYGKGLPRSPAVDIKFSKYSLTQSTIPLRVATHGRGIWEVPVSMEVVTEPEITSPAGGEIFVSTTQQIIAWYGFAPPVRVEYSIDDGMNWTIIAENVQSSPLLWTVPNRPTEFARVRITSLAEQTQVRISYTFTISLISKGSIIQNAGVNFIPYGIAYDGIGGLWTTSFQSNQLVRLNANTLSKEKSLTLPGDSLFTDLAYDRNNHIMYIHKMNSTSGNGGVIIVIDTTGKVIKQFNSPANVYPIGLEILDGKLIVGDRDKKNEFGRQVLMIVNPDNGVVEKTYPNPYSKTYGPRGLASDKDKYIYQIGTYFPSGGSLAEAVAIRIPKEDLSIELDRLSLQTASGLINARGIEFDPRDKNLWISDYNGNIYKIAGFDLLLSAGEQPTTKNTDKDVFADVFPNPASETINILLKTAGYSGPIQIELIDNLGNIISSGWKGDVGFYNTKLVSLSTRSITSGIYFVRIKMDRSWETKQVVVIK